MHFEQLKILVGRLADQIRESGNEYTMLVGIGRGGAPIASMLAHALDIRVMHYVNYSRRNKWGGDSFDGEFVPENTLFIDDATETGSTIEALKNYYGNNIHTAIITKHLDCKVEPTYVALHSAEPDNFVMPFEMKS